MSSKFWSMLVDFKIAERYYWYYVNDSRKWSDIISAICLITSATSISAWYIWKQIPLFWALLIASAQVISVMKPLFPFSSRLTDAKYMYQDIVKLVLDAESFWGATGEGITDNEFRTHISDLDRRFSEIESRFSTPGQFPPKSKLHCRAQQDAIKYFTHRYNIEMEEGAKV